MKLYVGNLPYTVTEHELTDAFGVFGEVNSVDLIIDKETGKSKGFGFVEMASATAGEAAIQAMNGVSYKGRDLTVNQARPREERSDRGGGGRPFRSDRPGGGRDGGGRGPGGGQGFGRNPR